jgi:sensor c-di-GMP phosphodiesterase-like protein
MGLLVSTVGVFATLLKLVGDRKEPPPTPSYQQQIKSLDETRSGIEGLLKFIAAQRDQLTASQKTIETLKSEEVRLKPIVEADKKVTDAMFAAQEARNEATQRQQAILGFVLGVLSSLMATSVWVLGNNLIKRYKASHGP